MKLFMIWQTKNDGYDTYDSAVVCAESEKDAKTINPGEDKSYPEWLINASKGKYGVWVTKLGDVNVEYLGEAKPGLKRGVIVASFNAG